jgi:excinuclease ABC subunit B
MERAIAETERRRGIQIAHNRLHGITPKPIKKSVDNSILAFLDLSRRLNAQGVDPTPEDVPLEEIPELIEQLETEMKRAAQNLEFEKAAQLRDRIKSLNNQ